MTIYQFELALTWKIFSKWPQLNLLTTFCAKGKWRASIEQCPESFLSGCTRELYDSLWVNLICENILSEIQVNVVQVWIDWDLKKIINHFKKELFAKRQRLAIKQEHDSCFGKNQCSFSIFLSETPKTWWGYHLCTESKTFAFSMWHGSKCLNKKQYFSCFSGQSHIDSSHAYRHMDAKDLAHQHNRLSAKRDISTRLNKILLCFNHSVCSIKVF